jgi:hypothetical protein
LLNIQRELRIPVAGSCIKYRIRNHELVIELSLYQFPTEK